MALKNPNPKAKRRPNPKTPTDPHTRTASSSKPLVRLYNCPLESTTAQQRPQNHTQRYKASEVELLAVELFDGLRDHPEATRLVLQAFERMRIKAAKIEEICPSCHRPLAGSPLRPDQDY